MGCRLGLCIVCSLSLATQAQVLWNTESLDHQVQVPCVINNSATTDHSGDGQINTYDCAGWWYGYGIGFSYQKPDAPEDLSSHSGYYMIYSAYSCLGLQPILAWDDGSAEPTTRRFPALPGGDSVLVELPWSAAVPNSSDTSFPLDSVVAHVYGFRVEFRNESSTTRTCKFILHELGWLEECASCGTPIRQPVIHVQRMGTMDETGAYYRLDGRRVMGR